MVPSTMHFTEVDELVGGVFFSARRYSAWWSNETDGRHVQTHAWREAGWRVDNLNLSAKDMRFVKR